MASIGRTHHIKCKAPGCVKRAPYWSDFCKSHRAPIKMKTEVSDAYQEGFKAYGERKGVRDNPYTEGTKMHDVWYSGWRQADREDGN